MTGSLDASRKGCRAIGRSLNIFLRQAEHLFEENSKQFF
ncbi:hypothetical protein PORCRE_894 [Porphyromonas crevioricanis JCM 15906]|uniref:Uncharacterized protein n=1 Tax=Porphyromonas crevioricanis JCM 15906 TaxID=1305617 RepID=T1DSB0_9PORP|nr:hypothetical protein PORCRE_894 [Porphyromonas crevioricanis JCM 15906]GAD06472.1 hypothetical protein PORCAN_68 [Porphyromonas crevioricanis JCM 13913]